MAFTPTSVIRKMHSDRVSEKEKQTKDGENDDGGKETSYTTVATLKAPFIFVCVLF